MPSTCIEWITANYPSTDQGLEALIEKPSGLSRAKALECGWLSQEAADRPLGEIHTCTLAKAATLKFTP